MGVWVSVSAGALNMASAYLSARWRTTALQVRMKCVSVNVFLMVMASLFFSVLTSVHVVLCFHVTFTFVHHAEFHLCLQRRLGWPWAISWWRWTGSAWRASPWAALWRSWRATTGWGWWWGGWARSRASATPRRRPHGEAKQLRGPA